MAGALLARKLYLLQISLKKIAELQSLPSVIARSVATWQSSCSNGGGFSDEIAALRSQ